MTQMTMATTAVITPPFKSAARRPETGFLAADRGSWCCPVEQPALEPGSADEIVVEHDEQTQAGQCAAVKKRKDEADTVPTPPRGCERALLSGEVLHLGCSRS